MKAWWMVFDHPYFAVTDAKGYFEIKNAPAGTQKMVVWQEAVDKNGFLTVPSGDEVVIKANDSVVKDLKLEPSRLRRITSVPPPRPILPGPSRRQLALLNWPGAASPYCSPFDS